MSGFASTKDLADKTVSFDELAPGLYGYTAEGDPNSGGVVGDDSVLVADAQATPAMAADVIARIRTVTDKPVKYIINTHAHVDHTGGNAKMLPGPQIIGSTRLRDAMVKGKLPGSGIGAVILNVTVTQPTARGFLTVWPDGQGRPPVSNLNFSAGETIPNLVVVKVGSGGRVDFYNGSAGTVQVIVVQRRGNEESTLALVGILNAP